MIPLKFISEVPKQACVWVSVALEGHSTQIPFEVCEALKRKVNKCLIEFFLSEKRYIATSLPMTSRVEREETGAFLYKKALEGNEQSLLLDIRDIEEQGLDLLTGMLLASFRFDKHKTVFKPEEKRQMEHIFVLCNQPDVTEKDFKRSHSAIVGTLYARDLTSEPPNVLYPLAYAERLKELTSLGLEVEILRKKELEAIGMSGILAVSKGSSHEPAVVIFKWNGLEEEETKPIVIAGKGVCFDSGGLCLKPGPSQLDMKWDKSGAGVVAGLMKALALQKAKANVIGIIGLVENMPDGNATRPGDVITTMSSQTVEIVDTDSEGRLVLADCLWYAQEKFHPKAMIDLGTLTVETIACLSNTYAGLFSNNQKLVQELKKAGEISGDLVWQLPMGPSFAKQIESEVADIKNCGLAFSGENAAAAEFLMRFVKDIPWAHLDIAGVSWTKEDLPLASKGVTGFGVRLLEEWLMGQN